LIKWKREKIEKQIYKGIQMMMIILMIQLKKNDFKILIIIGSKDEYNIKDFKNIIY